MIEEYPELYEKIRGGIYKIENLITGKVYIGSSNNLNKRISNHKYLLKTNNHHSIKLQNSYNKHEKDNFKFEIIERGCWISFLIVREQYWIDFYNSFNEGYNIAPFAKPCISSMWTEERRLKHAASMRGKQNALGHKHTEEAKTKIKAACKARRFSDKVKEQRRQRALGNNYALGKKWSKETIENMKAAQRKLAETPKKINGVNTKELIELYGTVEY